MSCTYLEIDHMKRNGFLLLAVTALLSIPHGLRAADKKEVASASVSQLSDAEKEQFLKTGTVTKASSTKRALRTQHASP